MRIGARVFKTGLAVTIAVIIAQLLFPGESPSLAGIGAITAMMPSMRTSYDIMRRRILSTTIGGLFSMAMLYIVGNDPMMIGITVILTIAFLNAIGLEDVLTLAGITVIVIMVKITDNHAWASSVRVLQTIIGVIVAFVVNLTLLRPKHDRTFYMTLIDLNNHMHMLIRSSLRKNADFSLMNEDLKWAKGEQKKLESLFDLMRNEVILDKQKRIPHLQRLVVYRHMINSSRATLVLMEMLHRYDHIIDTLSPQMRGVVRERIEMLMSGHEQILLKFTGRVPADEVQYINSKIEFRRQFIDVFYESAIRFIDADVGFHDYSQGLVHVLSAIYFYEEALVDLNTIIRIYKQRCTANIEEDEELSHHT